VKAEYSKAPPPLGLQRVKICCIRNSMNLFSGFRWFRAISSVVERLLHTQEVAGSNPASRTILLLRPLGEAILADDFDRLKATLYALLSLNG
jgi:hypothetical protein